MVGRLRRADEEGFTIVEMVVATTLLAASLLALAHLMFGSMSTLGAVRQRSVFLERATEEMEALRSLPWEETGVSTSDPAYATAYPGGSFEGRAAIAVASGPAAVSQRTTDDESYTVRRWITVGPQGAGANRPRRLDVAVEWSEEGSPRTIRLTSVRYPGGLGPATGENQRPEVTATASPTTAVAGATSVGFVASGTDPDTDPLTYAWDFGDGTTATGATAAHTYATAGPRTASVTVSDGNGGSDVATVDVTVSAPGANLPPDAVVTSTLTTGTAPFTVSFDASGSSDPDGDDLTYRWQWGDGTADGVGVSATHVFTGAGEFTVRLVVTDTGGATDSAEVEVETDPLNCELTDGYFQNPAGAVRNFIDVKGNGAPESFSFFYRATSNAACTSVVASIPYESGTFTATLGIVGTVNGVRTWQVTASAPVGAKFNVGALQTADFVGTGPVGITDRVQVNFEVRK